MKFFALMVFFSLTTAHAARLEDVKILDLRYEKEEFQVKFQTKEQKGDEHFTVDIGKDDEKALEKIAIVLMKAKKKSAFQLDLDIKSFSPRSGSSYRSPFVKFNGDRDSESLLP